MNGGLISWINSRSTPGQSQGRPYEIMYRQTEIHIMRPNVIKKKGVPKLTDGEILRSIEKIPEISRVQKILAKRQGSMEEPVQLPTEDLSRTFEDDLGILVDTHFPSAKIKKVPEMVDQLGKIRASCEDWKKVKQPVTVDKIRWSVKTFMSYNAARPDGIYRVCLKKGLDITSELVRTKTWSSPKNVFVGNKKNLWCRKCVRRAIFRVTLTIFKTRPLGHCAICKGSSYIKNEHNLFHQKLDAEYFFIQQLFRKKQYFPRKPWKTVLGAHSTIF